MAGDGSCGLCLSRQRDLGRACRGGVRNFPSVKHLHHNHRAQGIIFLLPPTSRRDTPPWPMDTFSFHRTRYHAFYRPQKPRVADEFHQADGKQFARQAARAGCREAGSPPIPLPAEQHPCPVSAWNCHSATTNSALPTSAQSKNRHQRGRNCPFSYRKICNTLENMIYLSSRKT